jgi:YggT family protein
MAFTLIGAVLLTAQVILIARAVTDWVTVAAGPAFPGTVRARIGDALFKVTEPVLAPIRRRIPPLRVGGVSLDLAFLLIMITILVVRSLI